MSDEFAKDMEDLLNAELFDNREKYGVEIAESSADTTTEALYERRREVMEDDVVGFHDHSTRLVQQLTDGNLQLGVVSIVGTCGLGKTTLARKIYNNVYVKSHFNCRAWVCISENFKIRKMLLEILKSEMPKSDELTGKKLFKYSNDDELKKKLFKCLKGRRYLIVMDDITTEPWDEVRSAFPDESNGSRILLVGCAKTTSLSHSYTVYTLTFLKIDESWELFSKKVFRGGTCPPELESLGRRIARHCRGLPLSIVVLGSLLATKEKTSQAWSELISILNWDLKEASLICEDILALTYILLPRHLKPCFLYFGVYPQGFEIPVSQLVQMWIAEGFIQHTGRTDPEAVAEEYLEELIDQSLIQVASRRTNGGVKTCRIHALIQDLCILESVKEKFLEVCTNVNLLLANKSLRVCIQGSIDPYISSNSSYPSRSLLFLGQRTYRFDPNHWKWVLENFKLLQVLNFGCVDLYSIPTRIEELIHLRYLAVESDALKAIPDSIGKLINLETLDFRGTFLNCLPKGIWMLPHLRNLYMSGPVSLPDNLDPEVRVLSSLQTLSTVSLNPQSDCPIVEAKLPNLRKLGICFAADEINNKVVDVLNCLHHLDHLQILKIINCSERPSLPISFPLSITKITLRHVRVKVRRDMKVLGKLPNLQILKLQSCLLSCKLYVFAGSFPKLQVLKLENLRIKKWKQRRGAMPCLKHLVIKRCIIELTMLPSNLWSLTALRDVELLWSTSDLAKMLWEMHMKLGFKLLVYPPATNDDLFEKTVNGSESRVSGVPPSQPIAPPLRPLVVHPIPHEFQGHPFSDGIRNCMFSSGLELGSFVVTPNVLHHSWAAISELYGENHEAPSSSSSSSSASPVRFRTFQQPNCTIIAFVTWPPCTKEHLQGQGGGDLVSSSALKETFPLFEFLCTKTNPHFSINKPAIDLFASVRGVLGFLKSQISTKPLIITGHALGGSVASLFTLWLLDTINLATTKRPLCITFGSPLIGDDGLQEAVLQYPAWNSCFLHVVSDRDPVPRVLISPNNPTASELASPTNGYKPFGTFLLYSELGCARLENPESVLELLMALETYSKGPGNQYPNQVSEFFDYKNIVQQLEGNVICKDSTVVDEGISEPFQADIIEQLEAVVLRRPQVNHHHSPGSSTKTTTPAQQAQQVGAFRQSTVSRVLGFVQAFVRDVSSRSLFFPFNGNKAETSRNNSKQTAYKNKKNSKQTEGPLRSKSNADQNGSVEERPQPQAGKVITPNLKLFNLAELKRATQNFSSDSVLCEGGFGRVFRAYVDETTYAPSKVGGVAVTVKKSNPDSSQGLEEWLAEVKFLGKLSHPNLVKLLGYCWDDKEYLLVYEYMQKGSLENHLFRRGSPERLLPWNTRLKIAIGAARGLSFLHTSEKSVIYGDFNVANILLDGDYNAKLSDFELAGLINGNSHVTTRVMGTYGYAAPEYVETGHLCVKSDVYGFGVVLLEMLTGLRAHDPNRPSDSQNLVLYAKPYLSNKRKLKKIMDSMLGELYPLKGACQAAQLILRCLESDPKNRPSMENVLEELENINAITMSPTESPTEWFFGRGR